MTSDSFHWGLRHSGVEDEGETLHLRNLGPQRTYGTCSFTDVTHCTNSLFASRSSALGRLSSREWLTHTVSNNETLAGIALKFDLTVEDIRRANCLWTNDNVWPGQQLKIPVLSPSGLKSITAISELGGMEKHSPTQWKGLSSGPPERGDKAPTTPTEFLTQMDSSIEEQKKASKSMRGDMTS